LSCILLSFFAGGLFRTLTASLWPRAPRFGFVPAGTRNDGGKTLGQNEERAMKEDDPHKLAWPI
jgi:diacylglycerol kinase family enzyme